MVNGKQSNQFMAYKLLFVCLGNICRSPSAENIMNHLILQSGLTERIICDSAGTSGYHIGNSPDQRMSATAIRKLGFPLVGKARQFQISEFQEFNLILAMDLDNYKNILSLNPTGGEHKHKVHLICDFCSQYKLKEVPDPYYGDYEGFDQVIDLLVDGCRGLLEYILSQGLI